MKKLCKKLTTFILVLCFVASAFTGVAYAKDEDTIVILYENDVHCAVEGYSKLAAMKNELLETYANVGVVSGGDFVQGGTLGAVSKGEYIVNLQNKVGYDAITLGNHEFDYRLERLIELNDMANTKFISCNFQKIGEDKPFFEPYRIVSYGDIDIAYIGITTPETITSAFPAQFKDENDNLIYTFNESKLYDVIQSNINDAKDMGADYVIALSHVGYDESGKLDDITDVIGNTDGFDAVLDAHSHSVIEKMLVKDKSGDDVLLTSTGTKFANIGKLTIKDGALDSQLVDVASYDKTDSTVDAYIAEIYENYAQIGNRKVAESKVDLITHDENGNRLIRKAETNLGDLCSEAFLTMTNSDISFVNGGGIRAAIKAGDVTFNDIFSVFPFNNQVVTAEISGQLIMDFLEMAMANYPEENGAFPHMAGITFSVNKSIPSSVKVDGNGFFEKVEGEYRVYNVKILDKASGEYKALELDKNYVISAIGYYIQEFGGGMTMFKDAKILYGEGMLDVEMLENFITQHLDGVIGEEYAEVKTNITFTEGVVSDDDSSEEPLPKPGDKSQVAIWVLVAVFGLSSVVALMFRRRKDAK